MGNIRAVMRFQVRIGRKVLLAENCSIGNCRIGDRVQIGRGTVIEDGVFVGPRAQIGAGCVIGKDARIGAGARLGVGVIVDTGARVRARATLKAGMVFR